ncbi:MAG: nuclear transport factor 2 family protein [Vicinamibacterales bacterium]|jgi:ketosteroid isomerase-like protein
MPDPAPPEGPAAAGVLDAVQRFNDALAAGDLTAVTALLSDDTVFENTGPAPDGTRLQGRTTVAAFWARWMAANPGAWFETEEAFAAGERCVVRWIYRKHRDGAPWHLRGVDVFTVRSGRIVEKLSYVKG